MIFERDLNDMVPLHYAVAWKEGLSILLEHVPVEKFEEGLACDIFAYALLSYRDSHGELCCEDCHCSECTSLFLDHSWYFAPSSKDGRNGSTFCSILPNLFSTVSKALLLHLKQCRQEIVGPALHMVCGDSLGRQMNAMDLPTDTTRMIIEYLQRTAALYSQPSRRAKLQAAVDSFKIYHVANPETADVAWQLGFRGVNYHAATDFPPLVHKSLDALRQTDVLWLLEHGANPFQPLHDVGDHKVSTLAAHKAIHCIRLPASSWDGLSRYGSCRLDRTSHEVARRLCSEPTKDSCQCACSSNGCTPFLILLRNLTSGLPKSPRHIFFGPKDYAQEFKHLRTTLYEDNRFVCQYDGQFHEALRFFTFTALGIRHTCCKKFGYWNEGDAEEIRDEDSELVENLESLMEQWHNVSFASANDFWYFLQNDWVICLDEVFDNMRQMDLSEENRAGLRRLGVRLHAPTPEADVVKPPIRLRSFAWCEESFWLELLDMVAEGGDTSYFDRILKDAYIWKDDIEDYEWDEDEFELYEEKKESEEEEEERE